MSILLKKIKGKDLVNKIGVTIYTKKFGLQTKYDKKESNYKAKEIEFILVVPRIKTQQWLIFLKDEKHLPYFIVSFLATIYLSKKGM